MASLSEEAATLARLVEDLQEINISDAGELKLIARPEDVEAQLQNMMANTEKTIGAVRKNMRQNKSDSE